MTLSKGLFSSNSPEWETPKDFFDKVNAKYSFTYDLACTPANQLCPNGLYDSLIEDWHKLNGWLWLNPPYGRVLSIWVKKAYEESVLGAKIIMLIPARTDTSYWHNYIFNKAAQIDFIKGRLKFSGKAGAPFPSALIRYEI